MEPITGKTKFNKVVANKILAHDGDESLGVGMPHVPNQDLSRFQMQANKLSKINESLRLPKSSIELRCEMIVLF